MIKELVGKIDSSKLQRMLEKTLLACKTDYADLLVLLEQKNWGQAGKQVHSFKTTASLLDCQNLVRSLEMIEQENLDLISQPHFLQQLEQEYLDCLDVMQQLLSSPSSVQ